jgi:hypothetical protein
MTENDVEAATGAEPSPGLETPEPQVSSGLTPDAAEAPPEPAAGREGGDGAPPPRLTVDHVMRVVGEVLFGKPPPHSLEHAALEVERRLKEREAGAGAGETP